MSKFFAPTFSWSDVVVYLIVCLFSLLAYAAGVGLVLRFALSVLIAVALLGSMRALRDLMEVAGDE